MTMKRSVPLRLRIQWLCRLPVACLLAGAATVSVAAQAGPAPALPRFDIYQYVVDGNSVLDALAIEGAVSPFLGERKTLVEVEAARAALEKRYHDAGYLTVVVSIPDQAVDSGEVSLHVVEAVIDRLKVKGAEYTLPSAVKAGVPELAEGQVPNFNRIQTQLAALNRGADSRVTPVLRAGKLPGTVEVQLDVDDQLPLHGSVELSNRQTHNTTSARLSSALRYDNLWQLGHSLGLTLQMAPQRPSDARVAAATYVAPLGPGGDALSVFVLHSRSEFASLASAPGLGLLGNTDNLGLRYTLPLGGGVDFSQTLAAGLDYKNVKQTLLVLGGGNTDSPIAYAPVQTSYSANWLGGGGLSGRRTALELGTTLGFRGLLGNRDTAFHAKRAGASANFMSLRAGGLHSEPLGGWMLLGKLDSQFASGPLVPNEQFTAGGAENVRGYLEGERAADAGLRASLELRTPAYQPAGVNSDWRVSALGFVDGARLKTLQPVAPLPAWHRLLGIGLGLRLSAPRGLTLEADAAQALVDGDSTKARHKRLHARAVWGF